MAQYPSSAGTDANLFIAKNNLVCLLNGALDSSTTTVTVNDTTGFPTAGYITIEAEAISYTGTTGTTFTGCTRGADSTTAASHVDASEVKHTAVAAHHNVLKDEVKAIEADLVAAFGDVTPAGPTQTDTSMANRIASILKQIKDGFGLTHWYDSVTAMLPKSGGTMSGAIAMGSNKITGLANGSASGDALAYGQGLSGSSLTVTGANVHGYMKTVTISNGSTTSAPGNVGILIISEQTVGYGAIFFVRGGFNSVSIMSDPMSLSATSDTASKFCVIAAGGGAYTLKNNLGSNIEFSYVWVGA